GPTHAGSFDLSYLRCIPNMVVMAPANENECRQMLYTGFLHDGPAAVRYPRGQGMGVAIDNTMQALPIGQAERVREGRQIAILSFGSMLQNALETAETLDASVINMRFIKPLDEQAILQAAQTHDIIVTLEDNAVMGGAGSAVNECLAHHQQLTPVLNLGLPDKFLEHGTRNEILHDAGLSTSDIIAALETFIDEEPLAKHVSLA
ncbi:MAG: transketolase C-terminal domain-containing protein, partial [Thioalkalispiraceae bacterium]